MNSRFQLRRAVTLAGAWGLIVVPTITSETASPQAQERRQDVSGSRRVVHVAAERFLFTPSEITVETGTVLEIRLTSEDTDHGFRIIGSAINVTIPKRGRGEGVAIFNAADPGDYIYECSHMCGAGHAFMRGRIRVKSRSTDQPAIEGMQ